MASITLHNVSTSYCLRKVNLEVAEGEFMVVLGPSGAGKSTVLNAVAGLISYTGSVYISGKRGQLSPNKESRLRISRLISISTYDHFRQHNIWLSRELAMSIGQGFRNT